MTEEIRQKCFDEATQRLDILGIPIAPAMHACFEMNEGVRSIPVYGDWFHKNWLYMGWFYTLKDNDALKQAIESVEGTYGCYVYTAIYNRYEGLGDMLTLLTISSDESEWEQEREDLKEMQPIAYVHNFTYPEFSEWGVVLLRKNGNVLERIG
jgi:hypothetical protein